MTGKIRVTVWNENWHERHHEAVRKVYPQGMHAVIAAGLARYADLEVRTATMDQPGQGLPDEVLNATDVLTWWGHVKHNEVDEELVTRVQTRVLAGMGLVVLHSGHYSKIFRRLMGTHCSLKWREAAEKERLWTIEPAHPIAEGIGEYLELPSEEMYGERFDIPTPDRLIFVSWFEGGEVFRSGCCFQRGHGRIFYFRPGHETYPTYYNEQVIRVIANACHWARPRCFISDSAPNVKPLEPIRPKKEEFGHAGVEGTAPTL